MTHILEKPAAPSTKVRSSRRAWEAIALTPVFWVLAMILSFVSYNDATPSNETTGWWHQLIFLVPPVPLLVASVLGVRAARSGNRMGAHAAGVAGACVAAWVTFWFAANETFKHDSSAKPTWLAAIVAAVVFAAVEGWCWSSRRGRRHDEPSL